jgi:hypothetical protein
MLTPRNYAHNVEPDRLLTTGEVARALRISRGAVLKWAVEGYLVPTLTTAGGHHRWDLEDVREQIREMNRKQREEREQKRQQRKRDE